MFLDCQRMWFLPRNIVSKLRIDTGSELVEKNWYFFYPKKTPATAILFSGFSVFALSYSCSLTQYLLLSYLTCSGQEYIPILLF